MLTFFFFNDTATTEIYTLSLHDALPILKRNAPNGCLRITRTVESSMTSAPWTTGRSEEHTSELQSQSNLVCRLLLEKKKKTVSQAHANHYDTHQLVHHTVDDSQQIQITC